MFFAPGAAVGDMVEDWSMIVDVGMGKSCAIRMTLEAIYHLRKAGKFPDGMLKRNIQQIKAMLRARAM